MYKRLTLFAVSLLGCWLAASPVMASGVEEAATDRETVEATPKDDATSAESTEERNIEGTSLEQPLHELRPWSPNIVAAQFFVGTGAFVGSLLLGAVMLAMSGVISPHPQGASPPLLFGGLALLASGPVVTPLGVSLTGNWQYPSQFLGAQLGALAGALVGGGGLYYGIDAIHSMRDSRGDAATAGFIGYALGTVAGSIVGYHLQAGWRHRSATDEASALQLTPAPVVDSTSRKTGVGLGLSGQF